MVIGIGIDMIAIARIERALVGRAGARFRDQVMTAPEQASHGGDAQAVARTFAAKEAVVKALGTGFGAEAAWAEIEIGTDRAIRLSGTALASLRARTPPDHRAQCRLDLVVAEGLVHAYVLIDSALA